MSRLFTVLVQTRRRLYIIPEGLTWRQRFSCRNSKGLTWRKDSVIGTFSYLNNNNNINKNDVDDDNDNDTCNNYNNNQVFWEHLENLMPLQYYRYINQSINQSIN